jgi:glycosyltransferase involved in cell wall biosynthesis
MVKVFQVVQRYYPYLGGIELHVQSISERLNGQFEVEVLTTDPIGKLPPKDNVNGVTVRRFKSWAPKDAFYFSSELKKYLANNVSDNDIVHAHAYHSFPALYAAQTKHKNKLVFTPHYHGKGHTFFRNLLMRPYKLIGKKIFKVADRVICVSNYERDLVIKSFSGVEQKLTVIPNGISSNEFIGLKKEQKSNRTILCVSRLEEYKGIGFLLDVLPKLPDDIHLEIIGKGPYKEKLKKKVALNGIGTRVDFFENLPRQTLLQKYANADLFALLSKYEAYGIVVAEALAAKTPCIVSITSALQEFIDNKNCFGLQYPIIPDELLNTIKQVIGKKISDVKLPDWDESAARIAEIYKTLN